MKDWNCPRSVSMGGEVYWASMHWTPCWGLWWHWGWCLALLRVFKVCWCSSSQLLMLQGLGFAGYGPWFLCLVCTVGMLPMHVPPPVHHVACCTETGGEWCCPVALFYCHSSHHYFYGLPVNWLDVHMLEADCWTSTIWLSACMYGWVFGILHWCSLFNV